VSFVNGQTKDKAKSFSVRPFNNQELKMILLKVIAVLIVLIRCCCLGKMNHFLSQTTQNSELIAKAMKDVVLHSLVKDKWTVEIMSFESDRVQCNKISDHLMKKLGHEAAYFSNRRLLNYFQVKKTIGNRSDVVFVINSFDPFTDFSIQRTLMDETSSSSKFLVYVPKLTSSVMEMWMQQSIFIPMTNFLFVVDDGGDEIHLKRVQFFSPGKCEIKQSEFVTINTFSKANASWKTNNFEFAAHDNMHGCGLNFLFEHNPPETIVKVHDNETQELGGVVKEIFVALGKELRFKPIFNPNTFINYPPQPLHTIPMSQNYEDPSKRCEAFLVKTYKFVIPPGELYSGWEKLALPFDIPTWILVAITFAAGLLTIQVIYQFPMFVRNFVFGRDVSTPTLNIFIAFYGLGQIVMPGRNFARFLLMMFILWSLIIRTAYQGVMFELLTGDGRKPEVKSMEEMIDRNFTLTFEDQFLKFEEGLPYPFIHDLIKR